MTRETATTFCSDVGHFVAKFHRVDPEKPVYAGASKDFGRRDYNDGFKVCYEWGGRSFAIPMVFLSLRDAEIATKSVVDELGECVDVDEVVLAVNRIGFRRLREVMTENLLW